MEAEKNDLESNFLAKPGDILVRCCPVDKNSLVEFFFCHCSLQLYPQFRAYNQTLQWQPTAVGTVAAVRVGPKSVLAGPARTVHGPARPGKPGLARDGPGFIKAPWRVLFFLSTTIAFAHRSWRTINYGTEFHGFIPKKVTLKGTYVQDKLLHYSYSGIMCNVVVNVKH